MTPRPLHEIRLRWSDHRHALWWLALLYRKPKRFHEALQTGARLQQIQAALRLVAHALPYEVLLCILGRGLLFGVLGLPAERPTTTLAASLLSHGGWIAAGFAVGIASGIAVGIASGIMEGIAEGISGWIAVGIASGIASGIAVGIASGIASGIAVGIASGIAALRYYYNLVSPLFIWPKLRSNWYPFHPVAWDDCCSVPFWDLDQLLAAYAEQDPVAGNAEIERLIDHYPSQRMPALRARTRLLVLLR
jgi:hypothetical protein